MSAKVVPSKISRLLRESHFAYFCTTDQRNQVHITPMFFLFDEETNEIFLFSHSRSKKIDNIRVNKKVCLTVDVRDPENPFENRGVMVQGEAIVEGTVDPFAISKDKKLMRIYKGFNQKYPVLSEAQVAQLNYQDFKDVLVRVRADKMVYWKGPRFVSISFSPCAR